MSNRTPSNVEDIRPNVRNNLKPFGFTISGAHVTIHALTQTDAIKRFQNQTSGTVTFITDADMKRKEEKRAREDALLEEALNEIEDDLELIA